MLQPKTIQFIDQALGLRLYLLLIPNCIGLVGGGANWVMRREKAKMGLKI